MSSFTVSSRKRYTAGDLGVRRIRRHAQFLGGKGCCHSVPANAVKGTRIRQRASVRRTREDKAEPRQTEVIPTRKIRSNAGRFALFLPAERRISNNFLECLLGVDFTHRSALFTVITLKKVRLVAQLVEQRPFKAWVWVSIPAGSPRKPAISIRSKPQMQAAHRPGFRVRPSQALTSSTSISSRRFRCIVPEALNSGLKNRLQ